MPKPGPGPSQVRITGLETFAVRVPWEDGSRNYVVARVETDAGVTGTAFTRAVIDPQLMNGWLKPNLLGRDLFAVDYNLKRLEARRGDWGGSRWSCLEHAMWDAIGRLANRPVAQLLGGYRDRLRVYRTTVWRDQDSVPYDKRAGFAAQLKKAGYTGIKVQVREPTIQDNIDLVGAIRQAAGPDFSIMVDRTAVRLGPVWDYQTALKVARGLERHGALWIEEPFDGYDLEGPARLAAEVDILITGGELGKTLFEFLEFLSHRTYDIIQPDTRICGGIWAARKIAVLAEAFHVPCIQHGTWGPELAGYIQAGCAMPDCEWQEVGPGGPILPQEEWAPATKLLRTPHVFRVEGGFVLLPDYPGIGLDVNEDALKEYRLA